MGIHRVSRGVHIYAGRLSITIVFNRRDQQQSDLMLQDQHDNCSGNYHFEQFVASGGINVIAPCFHVAINVPGSKLGLLSILFAFSISFVLVVAWWYAPA